jgi:hypothetical protein
MLCLFVHWLHKLHIAHKALSHRRLAAHDRQTDVLDPVERFSYGSGGLLLAELRTDRYFNNREISQMVGCQ